MHKVSSSKECAPRCVHLRTYIDTFKQKISQAIKPGKDAIYLVSTDRNSITAIAKINN